MIARLARRIGASLAAVVAVFSGAYVFLYLYRWEWNRAVISGFVFLAVVVVWSAVAVARRMQRLESSMTALLEGAQRQPAPSAPGAAASYEPVRVETPPRPRFAWLADDVNRLGVFVPVLLGSGVVLSGAAWLVERLAGVCVGRADRRRPHARSRRVVVAVAVVLGTALGVEVVRRATQSDPDELVRPGVTVMVVDLQTRDGRQLTQVAEALWVACAGRVPHDLVLRQVTAGQAGTPVRVELDGALGVTGRRRVEGCFEDLTVDRVLADVREIRVVEHVDGAETAAP